MHFLKKFLIVKIHPSWVILAVAVGMISGSVMAVVFGLCLFLNWIWLICGVMLIASALFYPTYALLIIPFLGGVMIMQCRASVDMAGQEVLDGLVGQTVVVTGTVAEDPDISEEKTALRIKDLCFGEDVEVGDMECANGYKITGVIYVQLAATDEIWRSDRVTLSGKLSAGFGTFAGTMYRPNVLGVSREEPGDMLLRVRNWFAAGVRKYISEPEVDLGLGYLLGVRGSLPDDLNEALKAVGMTHIVVASGANLAILVEGARRWLGKISRFCAFFGAGFLVLMYVGMVGMTASMVRAAIVTLLSLAAWFVGRKFRAGRLLLMVAAGTLLYNPMYLMDLGWGLSFAAFAGIMVVGPRLTKFLYGEKKPGIIMSMLIETLSANLLCLPLLLYTFGQVSILSVVANLIISPTIAVVMMLVMVTGVAAIFSGFGWLAVVSGKGAELILNFHLYIIEALGEQEMFIVEAGLMDERVFLIYGVVGVVLGILCLREWRTRKRRVERVMIENVVSCGSDE